MKQAEDNKTIDMLPETPKKRGRPKTGLATTANIRKAKSRMAWKYGEDGGTDWMLMSKTALIDMLVRKHPNKETDDWLKINALETLAKKFGFNVTVQKTKATHGDGQAPENNHELDRDPLQEDEPNTEREKRPSNA